VAPIYIKPKIDGLPRLAAGKLPDAESGEQTGNGENNAPTPPYDLWSMTPPYDLWAKILGHTISGLNFLYAQRLRALAGPECPVINQTVFIAPIQPFFGCVV